MASGLSPKLPLTYSDDDGYYKLIKTVKDMASQNLKMLVLTNPGERIMDSEFGVGIRTFLFENNTPSTYEAIRVRILEQTKEYLNYIDIREISFNNNSESKAQLETNIINLKIVYRIKGYDIKDILSLPITV
tara:strand:- start:671 stop:1066 length:396 start_codon:yes stop_codon:yes gene_type:complete